MGRPKKSTPAPVEPEEESQEVPEDEPETNDESVGKPINKAEAIRRALAEGLTKAEDAIPFIKSNFGHDVTPGHFAASKSREKPTGEPAQEAPVAPRRGRPPGKTNAVTVTVKRGRPPKEAAVPQAVPAEARRAPAPAASESGSVVGDLAAIKTLVAKLGVEEVKKIAELFG